MGLFNVLCPFSRLPIVVGEEIVVLAVSKNYVWDSAEVARHIKASYEEQEAWIQERGNDKTAILSDESKTKIFDRMCKVEIGKYNEYGWINDYNNHRPDEWAKGYDSHKFVYITKLVADRIVGKDCSTMNKLELLEALEDFSGKSHVLLWNVDYA